jgi:UDP-N-acetylmuramyl pentapeptide phosphotransferase/UDP-N-acetylglucosamine-1-phosphate transferase
MIASALLWLSAAVAAFAAAATLTIWLVPVLRASGAVALPGPDGRGRAVPRGGGLAIAIVTVGAGLVAAWLEPATRPAVMAWLVAAGGVALVSLRDDLRPLPALGRLVVHLVAAVGMVAVTGPIESLGLAGVGQMDFGRAAWLLTVLWIVGLTNAFNFMDGIDGIAGITAAATAGAVAFAAGAAGSEPAAVVALALAAGALGFLTSNWPPARVFMGDVGSTFCGFTIAALPLMAPPPARAAVLPVVVLALWPFLFDAGITLLKRIVRRENILEPHQSHLYQRLVMAGWSHRAVSSLYGFLAALCGGIATAGVMASPLRAAAGNLAAAVIVLVPVLLLTLVQVSEARVTSGAT